VTKTIILKEIEYFNPPSVSGLKLSTITIKQGKNKIILEAKSDNAENIYSREISYDSNRNSLNHRNIFPFISNSLFPSGIYSHSTAQIAHYYYYHEAQFNIEYNETISILDRNLKNTLDPFLHEYKTIIEKQDKNYVSFNRFIDEHINKSLDIKLSIEIEKRLRYIISHMQTSYSDIVSFLTSIHYVGALRSWPERIYFGTGGKPSYVGIKGEFTQEFLWLDKRTGQTELLKRINHWLKNLNFGIELEVNQVLGDTYQLNVKQNGLSINITDVGFGISQILPILTECLNYTSETVNNRDEFALNYYESLWYARFNETRPTKKCIISEQPEIHLNPKIQSQLGDLFAEIGNSNVALLVETHSEHLISRLQRKVVEKTIHPKDLAIYFVSLEENKSVIRRLSIQSNGTFDYWPEGFFQDDYEDSIEILKASLRNMEGV
jgi:hypothetical protein